MKLLCTLLTLAAIANPHADAAPDFGRMIPDTLPPSAAYREPGWCLWDPCVIRDDHGKYFLYYSRWPTKLGFDAWCTHAEIAWATADKPEGPYQFRGIALPSRGAAFWDGHSVFNTCVIRAEGKYFLYYTGNRGTGDWKSERPVKSMSAEWWIHRNAQCIGVAVADSPEGPWKRMDKALIEPGPGFGQTIVNVPNMIKLPGGGYRMYYKTLGEGPGKFGGGVFHFGADTPTPLGPFARYPEPMVNKNKLMPDVGKRFDFHIDDHFEWHQDGRFYAIVKDHDAPYLTPHGRSLLLFESPDGRSWKPSQQALVKDFSIHWQDRGRESYARLEMPKLLLDGDKPRLLSLAALPVNGKESFLVVIPLKRPTDR